MTVFVAQANDLFGSSPAIQDSRSTGEERTHCLVERTTFE
jgi:hypothetical protein